MSRFAIEAAIKEAYDSPSLMALGKFVIHVGDKSYGVTSSDATLLAVPFGAVRRRIAMRGRHCASFAEYGDAATLAHTLVVAVYWETGQSDMALGLRYSEIAKVLDDNFIDWGPDGDEAFDDGSHIYQFDVGDSVRIVACKQGADRVVDCISELWLPSEEFYSILDDWQRQFDLEWRSLKKAPE